MTIQVLVDITLLTVIMWASGGYRSGIPILILVAWRAPGWSARGGWCCFLRRLRDGGGARQTPSACSPGNGGFFTVGVTCIGFAIAQVGRLLALRAPANEDLAPSAWATSPTSCVSTGRSSRTCRTGVLVVGKAVVRQFNPGHRPAGDAARRA